MNLLTKQKQTHRHRKRTYVYQRRRDRGGINLEFGINKYILLYIKQVNSKDLLYSTGNYSQYLVIIYSGTKSEKNIRVCLHITGSLCYTLVRATHIVGLKNIVVKNPSVSEGDIRDAVQSLGQEDSVFLPENPMDRGVWRATVHGVAESNGTEATEHSTAQTR